MGRCNNENTGAISATLTVPFGTLSWVVWIVFMILYYGTGTISDWPVFWIWFPLWLPVAAFCALMVFALICALILSSASDR